ncbi:ATP-dependent endonuclease [candidate division TA06 bacterium]|uniref:ATP-dependent endonuclease n=1 Tax=candidate division TA06 bacterium TaxID=2250710 RepID=A0A523USI8_UNCT6|nr:MAG: ATP-dependent endonuclease [candidate division TA06 bacterium]
MQDSGTKVMYISEMSVKNFKSIEKEEFSFEPFSVLIGKNNVGKSNVLCALRLLLEGTSKDFSQEDFYATDTSIEFEAKIENVDHFLDLSSKAHRAKIESDIKDGRLRVRRKVDPTGSAGKLEVFDLNEGAYGLKTGIDAALKQLLPQVIFIEAFQDPSAEAQGKSSATLGKLIKQVLARVQEEVSKELAEAYEQANHLLNVAEIITDNGKTKQVDQRAQGIKDIERRIRANLQRVFGDVDVRIKIDFPEVSGLMASSRLELFDGGTWTPTEGKGEGVQRALYVALLRSLAEQLREDQKSESGLKRPFLLLIEEPEIFLHPTVLGTMRDALEDISKSNQVALATHSPSMVSRQTLPDVILVRKSSAKTGKAKTTKLTAHSGDLFKTNERRVRDLLQYQRSSKFLFADKVAVVEGPSDVILYEAIVEKWAEKSLDSLGLAIIDSESKDVSLDCTRMLEDLGLEAICVTDVDFLWRGAGVVCKGGEYSKFLEGFWEKAGAEGIVETNAGQKSIKRGKKRRAAEIIDQDFQEEREIILKELKNSRIWVLPHGEIEDYVGLSASSKGKYVEAARRVRSGEQSILHEETLKTIFTEGLGLLM